MAALNRRRVRGGTPTAAAPDAVVDDPVAAARSICLRLLSASPRSRAELEGELRRRHIPPAAAEQVLDRLGDVGLIDDRAFAEMVVSSRQRARGLGRRAIVAELRRRGVPDEVTEEATAPIDRDTEHATARSLVSRRLAATAGQPAPVRFRRLVGMLVRKGYGVGLAVEVVRESLAEADDPVHDAFLEDVDPATVEGVDEAEALPSGPFA